MSTGLFFVRAQDTRAERQAEGAVQVIERRQLTVLAVMILLRFEGLLVGAVVRQHLIGL